MSKKYAKVRFLSSKDEGYNTGYWYENLVKAEVYDAVIVPTRYGTSLAVVVDVSNDTTNMPSYCAGSLKAISEVIQSKTVAAEMQAEKKKDLERKIENQIKALDKIERFRAYGDNPAVSDLLKEYERL